VTIKYGLGVVFIAAIVAACSPTTTPVGSTRPTVTPTPQTSPLPLGAPVVAMSKAWPGVQPISLDLWHLAGGLAFVPIVATRDGKFLIGSTIRQSAADQERQAFVLMDPASGAITQIKQFSNPAFQATYADADDQWVVWVEASEQPNFDDWSMYSYNRSSRAVKVIARALIGQNGRPISGPTVIPRIDRGTVVWPAVPTRVPLGTHADVFSADLGTGVIRTIALDAVGPAISWPVVVYSQHVSDPDPNKLQVMAFNLQTGRRWAVTGVTSATYYAVNGDVLVWIDRNNAAVRLRNLDGTQDEVLIDFSPLGQGAGFVQFPSINERLVVWSQTGGAWAYDRKLKVRLQLASDDPLGYATVNGLGLNWFSVEPNAAQEINHNLKYLLVSQLP
jgi:hypothetical protein